MHKNNIGVTHTQEPRYQSEPPTNLMWKPTKGQEMLMMLNRTGIELVVTVRD